MRVDAPNGRTAEATDRTEVTLARSAQISSTATGVLDPSEHEVPLAGDTARVVVRVENTGNVSVTGLRSKIEERAEMTAECSADALAPGESATCTATGYALTQDDLDAGTVHFVAASAATGADRQRAETRAEHDLTIVRSPALGAEATIALEDTDDRAPRAGDHAALEVELTNRGNVTLSTLSGTAIRVGDATALPVTCPEVTIAPEARATCRLDGYALTQTDVDSGRLDFDVTGAALGADGRTVSAADQARAEIDRAPGLAVSLSAAHASSTNPVPVAGDGSSSASPWRTPGT